MRFVLLLIIPLLPAPSLAEIYKWIDDNGKVHYGDKPSDAAAIELDLKSGGIIDDSGGSDVGEELTREEKRQRLLDTLAEDRDERARIKDEQKQQKKNKKMKCAQLKDRLKNSKGATGIYTLDENGKRVYFSSAQRNKSEDALREVINKHCR